MNDFLNVGFAGPDKAVRIVTRADALLGGQTDRAIGRRLAAGELARIRPGAFAVADAAGRLNAVDRHLASVVSCAYALGPDTLFSHISAALIHGLPLWGVGTGKVHITKSRLSGGHVNSGLHTHCAIVEDDEIAVVDGFRLTSLTRTLVDLARTVTFEQAVVLLDAGLHAGLVTKSELADGVTRAGLRHGTVLARRAVEFSTSQSESVGESRSRVQMHRYRIPIPALQHEVVTPEGVSLGRSDFWWEGQRMLGEFDGQVKYGRYLRAGESAGDAVFREKRREDQFRGLGNGMVRWVWAEIGTVELAMRWCRALDIPFRPLPPSRTGSTFAQ